jgi:thioester reductase-like protein
VDDLVSPIEILAAAAEKGIPTATARIGQLAGSSRNGAWNITDWFPHIVTAAFTTKTLPVIEKDIPVAWLPVDVAARAVSP